MEQSPIDVLNQAFKSMGIRANAVDAQHNPPYHEYKVQLDPSCTVKKIENRAVEIGLVMKCSAPICTPDYQNGVIRLEMMDGDHPVVDFDELVQESKFWDPEVALEGRSLPVLVGTHDVSRPLIVDLASLPHLLVAGTTGSGKSMLLHTVIRSLSMHTSKNPVKMVLIDPKYVEFSSYSKMKCLWYTDIISDTSDVIQAMKDLVDEMESRLKKLKMHNCRDFKEYRAKTSNGSWIVVVIDELADIMSTAGKEFEDLLCRLAQKARAAGIHLIGATQYPSAKIITKGITTNFLGRICFRVPGTTESRVVLGDQNNGAMHLQGKGDGYLIGDNYYMQRFRGALVKMVKPEQNLISKIVSPLVGAIS